MINLIEVMPKECFDEILVPFEERAQHRIPSEVAEPRIFEILVRHKIEGAMGMAMFLAAVCSGIRWETPDPKLWVAMQGGGYLDRRAYDETTRSMQAQYS